MMSSQTKEYRDKQVDDVPICRSYRYGVAGMVFLFVLFNYVMRVNFSVAIVCMIKPRNMTLTNVTNVVNTTSECRSNQLINASLTGYEPEFDWDQATKSKLLASFFYGYMVTQIPGGWMARRYGSRITMGVGMLVCVVATMLLPVCARTNVILVYVLRVVAGLSSAVTYPSLQCLWGRWVPPNERSRIPASANAGQLAGTLLTLSISGFMCDHGFDGGWPSIFYLSGLCTLAWLPLWAYMVYDTPSKHPRISLQERVYIATAIGDSYHDPEKSIPTPWRKMLRSRALWAVIIGNACSNWTVYTLITALPSFMNDVHQFNIESNGLLLSIPYMCGWIANIVAAKVADCIIERHWVNVANTRRLMQSISFVGVTVFLIAAGFVTCETRMYAVVFLSLAVFCNSFYGSGIDVNYLDFAPRYAGELLGIGNTAATLPGMIAPIVNGALTPNGTQAEWQTVFYLCGGFAMFGLLSFNLLVRGELEPWAMPRGVVIEIEPTFVAGEMIVLDESEPLKTECK